MKEIFEPSDLRDTGAKLYQLSYEASLEAGQECVQYIPVEASEFFLGFLCNCFSCFITARITFTSSSLAQIQYYKESIEPMMFFTNLKYV